MKPIVIFCAALLIPMLLKAQLFGGRTDRQLPGTWTFARADYKGSDAAEAKQVLETLLKGSLLRFNRDGSYTLSSVTGDKQGLWTVDNDTGQLMVREIKGNTYMASLSDGLPDQLVIVNESAGALVKLYYRPGEE